MNAMQIGVAISAYDHASGIVGQIGNRFKKLKVDIQECWSAGKKLRAIGKGMGLAGESLAAAGAAGAAALGFQQVAREGADAEHQLYQIANIAEWSTARLGQVRGQLLGYTAETNQTLGALATGLGDLLAKGMEEDKALRLVRLIGKSATAASAEVQDLSSTLYSAVDIAGVPVAKAERLMDALVTSGKLGAFELKAMARFMPSVLASTSALGMKGTKGVVQAASWLQVARKGAGTEEEAATNFQNFLMKLQSPEAERNFAKLGANLKSELAQGVASGDLIGHMVRRTLEITKGDVGKLFQDQQVLKFMNVARTNLPTAQAFTAQSLASRGVVDRDQARIMQSLNEQTKRFGNLVTKDLLPKLTPWLARLNSGLALLARHPALLSAGINMILLALVGGGLLKFGSIVIGLWSPVTRLWAAYTRLASSCRIVRVAHIALARGYHAATAASWGFIKSVWAGSAALLKSALGGLKVFTLATWGTVKALLAQAAAWAMTPFGMITIAVVALAGAGIWLWKNWDKVKNFFVGCWKWFSNAWSKVPGWAKWLFPMIQIPMLIIQNWGKVKGFFSATWDWLKGLWGKCPGWLKLFIFPLVMVPLAIIRNWDKIKGFFGGVWDYIKRFARGMHEAGKNIVASIVRGMLQMAMAPVNAIKGIMTRVRRFLPFSPAKEGPLSDIHKVGAGLLGTITAGLRPEGLLSRVGAIAGRMRQAFAGSLQPGGLARLAAGAAGAGAITLSITVNVQGGGPGVKEDVKQAVLACVPEIEKALATRQDRQQRGVFK